jgi:hypothetical protein
VSGRLVLPGTLPRIALTRERNQVRSIAAKVVYYFLFEGSGPVLFTASASSFSASMLAAKKFNCARLNTRFASAATIITFDFETAKAAVLSAVERSSLSPGVPAR